MSITDSQFPSYVSHWKKGATHDTPPSGWSEAAHRDLNDWDVSSVTNMDGAFYLYWNTDLNVSNWNVSNVTTMESMFSKAVAFNKPLRLWNTSNVTNMKSMFSDAVAFNNPLDWWDTSKVTTMESMFSGATIFLQSLYAWDVAKVSNFTNMFAGATEMLGRGFPETPVKKIINDRSRILLVFKPATKTALKAVIDASPGSSLFEKRKYIT